MRGRYNNADNDLISRLVVMERRLKDLEKGTGIGSTTIDSGSLTVTDGSISIGTIPSMYFGSVLIDGSYFSTAWIFRRADTSMVLTLDGTTAGTQFLSHLDRAQNIVVADDGPGGTGLARPHLNINFVEHSNTVPTVTTTSATFVPLFTGHYQKQHPRINVDVLARSSAGGTTGEVQLYDTNTGLMLGSPAAVTSSFYGVLTLGPFDVDGDYLEMIEIEVQARRTAGAGTIGVRVMCAYGEGTSA